MKIIVPGSTCKDLAKKVSLGTNIPIAEVEKKIFPDGETYIRIKSDVKKKEAIIIQSTYEPQNDNLMELFFIVSALKENSAKKIGFLRLFATHPTLDERIQRLENELF